MHNVLVSGATRGLGLGIARKLVIEGHRVIGLGRRNSADFEALRKQVSSERLEFIPLDLSNTQAIHASVRYITERFGPLYGLVNNAALGLDGALATMHNQQIRELVEVNVIGTIVLTKYACRTMLTQRTGRIVNISSIIAETGFNGLSVYAATKSALNGFARSLARELGRANITVNSVAPGYMETDMTSGLSAEHVERIRRRSPMNRLVAVDEVAAAVSFLMSDAAAAITGIVVTVDAGSTAWALSLEGEDAVGILASAFIEQPLLACALKVMRNWPPVSITTDKLGSYPKALRRLKREGELKDTVPAPDIESTLTARWRSPPTLTP